MAIKLRALKTFYNAGEFTVAGDTFTVEDKYRANAYIDRELAEVYEEQKAEETAPYDVKTVTPEPGESIYDDKNVSELRQIAKDRGIVGYYNMKKDEIIHEIRATDVERAD